MEERAKEILRKHGYNSSSYHTLKGKKYFFGNNTEGFIAYVEEANTFLAAGDAVCADHDAMMLVHDFRKYCARNRKDCCFQAITKKFRNTLDVMGFGFVKIGEEPFFDMAAWNITGSKFQDLRTSISKAKRSGFSVKEYRPLEQRNEKYESRMMELSKKWLRKKKTGEFSFLVGSPSLDDPGDRKYFVVVNSSDDVEAFLVCTPIYARNGIYFDIMRRKEKPAKGTTELLITETFKTLKDQGYSLASLGSAPLADVTKDDQKKQIIKHALEFAYHNLNYFYRFKPLFLYKQQFNPTSWEPKYLAYYPPRFKPKYIYAIMKAYDPKGVNINLLSNIRSVRKGVVKVGSRIRKRLP